MSLLFRWTQHHCVTPRDWRKPVTLIQSVTETILDKLGHTQPRVDWTWDIRAQSKPLNNLATAPMPRYSSESIRITDIESHFNSRDLFDLCIGGLSARRFWATDGTGKWAFFLFYLASHNHIYIVKNTSRVETVSLKIWHNPLPSRAKCSSPVSVPGSKASLTSARYYFSRVRPWYDSPNWGKVSLKFHLLHVHMYAYDKFS